MPRAKANKLYRTFVKGLITEAGYLTYPEDASTDELNTVLSRKGNRTRRLGINYEDEFELVDLGADEDHVVSEFVWRAADDDAASNMLCLQVGKIVHFFGLDTAPVSDSQKAFTIDLADYKVAAANDSDLSNNYATFSAGKGYLFVVHPYVDPICVEYDSETDTITPIRVIVQMRDFQGVYDALANDEEPSTLSNEHHYNLLNQGWVTPGTRTASGGGGGGSGGGSTIPDSTYYNPYTGEEQPYEPGGVLMNQGQIP